MTKRLSLAVVLFEGFELLDVFGPLEMFGLLPEQVDWQKQARWAEDDHYFTSSGVSAGIDMSLALIARISDQETAEQVAMGRIRMASRSQPGSVCATMICCE